MNGNKLFVDTNIILYLFSGDKTISELLQGKQLFISFITQLELLGFKDIVKSDKDLIKEFISQCTIIDINPHIKQKVIDLKQMHNLKLPDSIIIASALYLDLPLISADLHFKKVEELNLLFYDK